MGLSTDTLVQIALAVCLGVLTLVSGIVGWVLNIAARKLISRLDLFGEFISDTRAYRAATDVRLDGHEEKLSHHQRWLEEHQQILGRDKGCMWRETKEATT